MNNSINKIIIPNDWKTSLDSKKSKEEILKNLSEISRKDIESIWEEITTIHDNKTNNQSENRNDEAELKRNKECTAEHALMVREFLLRLWFTILHIDPIIIAWKPIHICQRWDEILVYDEFEQIWRKISWVYALRDTNSDAMESVIEVKWRPTLVTKMWDEDIIIWWNKQIDAWIFFRNHIKWDHYTIQEITEFLEKLDKQ